MNACRPALVWTLASTLCLASLPLPVHAGLIGTPQIVAQAGLTAPDASAARALLGATLQRADVAQGLRAQGVDPAAAQARVDALTDAEAVALAQRIEAAPAGASDVLSTIVFIFVLLLITDILGFTKVFPFTRSVR